MTTETTQIPTIPHTAAEVIDFALQHLEAYEVAMFLSDWKEGKDLKPWLDAWHQVRQVA